ncbi:TPA: type IV pilus biogenesis protein PilM [Citrobacter sedlakii]|nr:type IV pilus biogenesis protein PilM [Citrobacter sedlakii]HCA7137689.1 type IV pilus biogenesis protein PilM [Citrobacter sedlakii]HCA7183823.1 type IV pilus biogenesis protein PilM [Citrobacter sedlakii]
MKSLFVVALCLLAVAIYQNSLEGNDSYIKSIKLNKVSLFLNYTSVFDDYYLSNANANGDVTNKVTLPVWLPVDNTIKMYVNSGYGYVFMPSASGVLSELLRATDNSALIGFSDNDSITTLSGKIAKPAFIPAGYIVYVR